MRRVFKVTQSTLLNIFYRTRERPVVITYQIFIFRARCTCALAIAAVAYSPFVVIVSIYYLGFYAKRISYCIHFLSILLLKPIFSFVYVIVSLLVWCYAVTIIGFFSVLCKKEVYLPIWLQYFLINTIFNQF